MTNAERLDGLRMALIDAALSGDTERRDRVAAQLERAEAAIKRR